MNVMQEIFEMGDLHSSSYTTHKHTQKHTSSL